MAAPAEALTLDTIVRAHSAEEDDSEFVRLVVSSLIAAEDPAALIIPLVRGYLLGRRRAVTRTVEHAVWRNTRPEPEPSRGARAVSASNPAMLLRLRPLLNEMIYVPGAGNVRWGDATVTQLRERIAMYEAQKQGADAAIRDLRAAVEMITAKPGASCLNDVLRM